MGNGKAPNGVVITGGCVGTFVFGQISSGSKYQFSIGSRDNRDCHGGL